MMESSEEKKKIFYTIVLILTLITMIVGATLAYFSLVGSQKEETSEYELVLFIEENDKNQNVDQGKEYKGTIIVEVIDGSSQGQISGCVGEDCKEQ